MLGTIARDAALAAPSRHLGLVPAAERDEAAHALDALADQIAEHVDLDAVLAVARDRARPRRRAVGPAARGHRGFDGVARSSTTGRPGPVVAMAGGRAFTFRYAETEELLRAAGCEVVTFDPLADPRLPDGTAGIYLGGGFPEVHARELTANAALRRELAAAIAAGVPTVAECAGLLYLCDVTRRLPHGRRDRGGRPR